MRAQGGNAEDPAMPIFRLGGPHVRQFETDKLRGDAFEYRSPRGLPPAIRLLVEGIPKKPVKRILTGMDTEGAVALAAAAIHPEARVVWFHIDAYVTQKVRGVLDLNEAQRVETLTVGDAPDGVTIEDGSLAKFDLVVLPFPGRGEALLMRDMVEAAHDALAVGGRFVAATDVDGTALRKEIERVFGNVIPGAKRDIPGAQWYAERRTDATKRTPRSHVVDVEIANPKGGPRTRLSIETRPGTFSHGGLDPGTRSLLEWYLPGEARTVLDLGAGCGWIGIYAAKCDPECRVLMVESNARAVDCAKRNIERNGVAGRVDVILRADLEDMPNARQICGGSATDGAADPAPAATDGAPAADAAPAPAPEPTPRRGRTADGFDLCLANPPYFSDYRIARAFATSAREAVRRGGRVAFVLRQGPTAHNHAEVLDLVFRNCTPYDAGEYSILVSKR